MSHHHHHRSRFRENRLACLDIETISGEEMPDGGFPPWCTHVPIVASILIADRDRDGLWSFAIESVRFGEDDQPMERIEELIKGRSVVTFNGRNFDIPVLMLTAQKLRSFSLPALTAVACEPRYHSARHYDLADRFSQYGAARGASLERLCEALNIPAKVGAHGSEVGDLYDRGEIETIEHYCEGDTASTLLLLAHQRATEAGDPLYFSSLTFQFARWVRHWGLEHLLPFAEVRDIDELATQSLIGQLDAALDNARIDAELRDKQALDASFTEITHY